MPRSSLCDSRDAYILVSGTITITGAGADNVAKQKDERDNGVIIKNCAPFSKYISVISNKQVDDAQETDAVMPMHNLIEYSHNNVINWI